MSLKIHKINFICLSSIAVKKGKCDQPVLPFNCRRRDAFDECDSDAGCDGIKKCCFDGCVRKCSIPLASKSHNLLLYYSIQ